MLIPPPVPSYTLDPDIGPLDAEQERALQRCLDSLVGEVGGVLVTALRTRAGAHVIEVVTPVGPMTMVELRAAAA